MAAPDSLSKFNYQTCSQCCFNKSMHLQHQLNGNRFIDICFCRFSELQGVGLSVKSNRGNMCIQGTNLLFFTDKSRLSFHIVKDNNKDCLPLSGSSCNDIQSKHYKLPFRAIALEVLQMVLMAVSCPDYLGQSQRSWCQTQNLHRCGRPGFSLGCACGWR